MTHTRFNIRPAALALALLVGGASSLLSASAMPSAKDTPDGSSRLWATELPKPIQSDGRTNTWATELPKPIQSDGRKNIWATELPKPIQSDGRTTAWAS